MTMDYPLVAKAKMILKFQNEYTHIPVIENKLAAAQSIHDFASAYMALWLKHGSEPELLIEGITSKYKTEGIKLCRDVVNRIEHGDGTDTTVQKIRKDVRNVCKIQKQSLAVGVGNDGGYGLTRYRNGAESRALEERAKKGISYHKTRKIRTHSVHPLPQLVKTF